MTLRVYNTLTRQKETFQPLEPGKVRMYNCGPTVYGYAHIGNFASFLMADLLRRFLEYSGYQVTQVMNITDVGHLTQDDVADAGGEDKLEKRAREEKKDPWEIARFYEQAFHEDRRLLGLRPAACYPRATDHIPDMIAMIRELLDAGLAYEAGGQIYFEIAKFPSYGALSGNTVAELLAGHRVEEDPNKRSPLDFTLWKKDPKHIMQWDSPFGRGFPGWHIECSAMSRRYLGRVFDIHTGGEDNIFPHHECEIAQSSAGTGTVCARYWLHRRYILVDGKKMSKSLGNFYTVRDLVAKGYTGPEIRLALLSTHYRTNSNFTLQGLDAARETLRYLREFRRNMLAMPEGAPHAAGDADGVARDADGVARDADGVARDADGVRSLAASQDEAFRRALDDDLNISAALAAVHGFAGEAYKRVRTRAAGRSAAGRLEAWDSVLGVLDDPSRDASTEAGGPGGGPAGAVVGGSGLRAEEIETLIARRLEARSRKDFAEADRIRDHLRARGIAVKDTPQGTRWGVAVG